MKTERMWKNYYRGRNVPLDGNTGGNKDSVPEQDGMKNSCPEREEQKTLHQGNTASAAPPLHFSDTKRKVGRKQTVNTM
ncbi:MAG: hypothetical protein LBG28_15305 [Tannerella sp.]|nr:hypothetical protein [Tannerella sp.]